MTKRDIIKMHEARRQALSHQGSQPASIKQK